MAESNAGKSRKSAGQSRDQRLKSALKANMARRKAQARARAGNEAGNKPEIEASAGLEDDDPATGADAADGNADRHD